MKLLHTPSLVATLSNTNVLIDTTTLINASKSEEYLELLAELVENGCALITIPSVVYEFTRGAKDITQFNKQNLFLKKLNITILNRVDETINNNNELRTFQAIYNMSFNKVRGQKGPSYTDSLLCTWIYKYRHTDVGLKLLTENHHDVPESIFDREELITIVHDGELHTEALYSLSDKKLGIQLKKLDMSI